MWNKLIDFSKKIITPFDIKGWISNILIAIPRIIGGLLLTIDFGSSKFGMPWTDSEKNLSLFQVASWFPEDVAKFGIPFSIAPVFFAWMAAASEAIGGLFLALGFQTRISSFLIACTMLVAIFFQKFGEGTWNMLPAMGFLWISIYSIVLGSGKIGFDYLHSKKFLTNNS
jgi:putative oxidoreductase